MRLSILAQGLRVAGGVAVGHNMIAALGRARPDWRFQLFVPADCGYEQIAAGLPHAELVGWRHTGRLQRAWFDARTVPRRVREFRPDVLFALQGRGMLDPPCPQAAFPQMSHLFYPSRHHGKEPLDQKVAIMLRRHDLRRHLRHTELILCQTEVVERRIRAVFGYEGDAYVCGSAVPEFMHGSGDEPFPAALEPVKTQFRLFSLSKYYAHKNLEVLVELFRRYPEQLNGIALIVTVAADQHANAGRFLKSIDRHGLADRIVNVGPIAAREVPGYYRHTQALIKPTLIETLGLPFLEAMHFGLPILTSDLDFARAVCGDAAEYFDPWSPASILQAVLRVKEDETRRSRLVENGANRLKTAFSSWDEIARKTAQRFERMAR